MADYVPWTDKNPPPVGKEDAWADWLFARNSQYNRDQWRIWVSQDGIDKDCPSATPFKTQRTDSTGGNFGGASLCVEKPPDAPEGYAAYGDSGALPGNDPRITGGVPGEPATTNKKPLVTEGKAGELSLFTDEQLRKYNLDPLTRVLVDMFNTQRNPVTGEDGAGLANLFGMGTERLLPELQFAPGETGYRDPYRQALPGISGRILQGGGLMWGGEGFIPKAAAPVAAVAKSAAAPAAPAAPVTPPTPPPETTCPRGSIWDDDLGRCVKSTLPGSSPLSSMLAGQPSYQTNLYGA